MPIAVVEIYGIPVCAMLKLTKRHFTICVDNGGNGNKLNVSPVLMHAEEGSLPPALPYLLNVVQLDFIVLVSCTPAMHLHLVRAVLEVFIKPDSVFERRCQLTIYVIDLWSSQRRLLIKAKIFSLEQGIGDSIIVGHASDGVGATELLEQRKHTDKGTEV